MLSEDLTLFNLEGARPGDQWGYSSAGRAPALQAGGQRFDPVYLHHPLFLERGRSPLSFFSAVRSKMREKEAKRTLRWLGFVSLLWKYVAGCKAVL